MSFRMVSYSISSSRLACTSDAIPLRAFLRDSFDDAYVILGYREPLSQLYVKVYNVDEDLTKTNVPSSGLHEMKTILFLSLC
jgi:hypothetical protein